MKLEFSLKFIFSVNTMSSLAMMENALILQGDATKYMIVMMVVMNAIVIQ